MFDSVLTLLLFVGALPMPQSSAPSQTVLATVVEKRQHTQDYSHRWLVLLCYKRFGPQKGQHGSCRINARASLMRSVVME
jgi:hypothetical protein